MRLVTFAPRPNSPYHEIPLHAELTEKLDWNVELGVSFGKSGKNTLKIDHQHAKIATKRN